MRPASIFERSSTSLMRRSRCLPLTWMSDSGSLMSGGISPYSSSRIISVKPRMAFIGVRSSWLMLARKADLARLACSSLRLSERKASRGLLLLGVQPRQLAARLVQPRGQRAELVAVRHPHGAGEVAGGHVAQVRVGGLHRQDERPRDDEAPDEGEQDGGHRQASPWR